VTHTYLYGAWFECEQCGCAFEDHPMAFEPHYCESCEELAECLDPIEQEAPTHATP
jgi:hypothetical protein